MSSKQFGLDEIKDALVGIPGISGLSNEQRKRLTIAVELISNPSIIFMDEPTSGLDARAASIVMSAVKNVSNTGRTVVCTIHQPSIDIFETFNELILMKKGGQIIYSGPLGEHSSKLIDYFQAIPKWWVWCYLISPTSWSLNAIITSQYGDIKQEITVFGERKAIGTFLEDYYRYRYDKLGVVAIVNAIFPLLFASLFAFAMGKLNFQRR